MLIDTCVWLDLAKDNNQHQLLGVLEGLISDEKVQLIVPRITIAEFQRNKDRIVKDITQSFSSNFKRTREAIVRLADAKQKNTMLKLFDNFDHKVSHLGEGAKNTYSRIEKLLVSAKIIEITDSIKMLAAQRAIDKLAPFHRDKNSIGDAIIVETYIDTLKGAAPGERFCFVTHNVKDFSLFNGDTRLPHVDFQSLFTRTKSRYFIKLSEALKTIDKNLVTELMVSDEWVVKPRELSEMVDAINEMVDKVWYDRHQNRLYKISKGLIQIVPAGTPFDPKTHAKVIHADIWEGARKAAAKVEKKYGVENLGPYTDFEWGMLNGKLSAVRWALGEEWDMLDT